MSRLHAAPRLLLSAILPLVFVLTGLRLLLTDAFVQVEYRTPNFPADPYGLTFQDRLHWAPIALQYVLRDVGVEFLGDLRFESGDPVYNARELKHMQDVQTLVHTLLRIWVASLAIAAGLALWIWQRGERSDLAIAFLAGSRLTILLMVVLSGVLAVSFTFLFVGFHHLFFEGNTWTFPYSDTLIRLFPERFWRDTFIAFIVMTLALSGLTLLASRSWLRSQAA